MLACLCLSRALVECYAVFADQGGAYGIAHLIMFRKANRGSQPFCHLGQEGLGRSTDADDRDLERKTDPEDGMVMSVAEKTGQRCAPVTVNDRIEEQIFDQFLGLVNDPAAEFFHRAGAEFCQDCCSLLCGLSVAELELPEHVQGVGGGKSGLLDQLLPAQVLERLFQRDAAQLG